MNSPTIEQLRHLLAAAQAENRPDEEARLMRMIEARTSPDAPAVNFPAPAPAAGRHHGKHAKS
jgi:hypothetical protein